MGLIFEGEFKTLAKYAARIDRCIRSKKFLASDARPIRPLCRHSGSGRSSGKWCGRSPDEFPRRRR